jgi:hypothetical protein
VIGIPGRIIQSSEKKASPCEQKMNALIGFEAYGESEKCYDPIAKMIAHLLKHTEILDQQLLDLLTLMNEKGFDMKTLPFKTVHSIELLKQKKSEDNASSSH